MYFFPLALSRNENENISEILVQAKLCVDENIPVIPIPGPSALVTALCASGLNTDEFTFGNFLTQYLGCHACWFQILVGFCMPYNIYTAAVGFLPKHAGLRRERLTVSANEMATQIFYVPPHKLHQFLEETSLHFGGTR